MISSIFDSGFAEFDQNVAFVNLSTLENFFDLNFEDRKIEIYLKNPKNMSNKKKLYNQYLKMILFIHGQI